MEEAGSKCVRGLAAVPPPPAPTPTGTRPAPTGTPTPTDTPTPTAAPHLCVVACLGPSRDDLGRHPKGRADDGAAARHCRRHLRRHAEVGQLDDAALGEEQVARLRDATRRVHAQSTRSAAGALGDRALGGGPHGRSVALPLGPERAWRLIPGAQRRKERGEAGPGRGLPRRPGTAAQAQA